MMSVLHQSYADWSSSGQQLSQYLLGYFGGVFSSLHAADVANSCFCR